MHNVPTKIINNNVQGHTALPVCDVTEKGDDDDDDTVNTVEEHSEEERLPV